jgi:hypothetical protein
MQHVVISQKRHLPRISLFTTTRKKQEEAGGGEIQGHDGMALK